MADDMLADICPQPGHAPGTPQRAQIWPPLIVQSSVGTLPTKGDTSVGGYLKVRAHLTARPKDQSVRFRCRIRQDSGISIYQAELDWNAQRRRREQRIFALRVVPWGAVD